MRRSNPFSSSAYLLGVILVLAGCSGEPTTPDAPSSSRTATIHSVRGVVKQLPAPGGVPFLVQHEAIPDFVDIRGRVSPMAAMTMPFAVADERLLEGIAVGDAIVFELRVDWEASPAIAVTGIEPLPAGMELQLEEAAEEAPD